MFPLLHVAICKRLLVNFFLILFDRVPYSPQSLYLLSVTELMIYLTAPIGALLYLLVLLLDV
jgi:hypothetical protein